MGTFRLRQTEIAEGPRDELIDLGVQVLAYGGDLILREALYAHRGGHPLHLPGARAGGVHLGHGRYDGPVHPLVALDHVVGEEAASPELGDPERKRAHARDEAALAMRARLSSAQRSASLT